MNIKNQAEKPDLKRLTGDGLRKKYIFEGGSDDTFGECGVTDIDYDDCGAGSAIEFTVSRENGEGVIITGQYRLRNGVWQIGAALLDYEHPLGADWRLYFEQNEEAPYRNRLVVEAPTDAVLKCLRSGEVETGEEKWKK